MVPGFGVSAECQSIGTSGKKQRAVARSGGLVIQPQKLSIGVYFELSFLGCGFLFIFPIGQIALDSEPRGRRYVKNMGHNRNRLYSRAIHCPEKHYVQWFILKSVQDNTVCEKNLVSRLSAKAQEPVARSRGLVIQTPKLLVGAYFELSFLGCGFLIHLFQQVRQPSIPSPVEEDTPKI